MDGGESYSDYNTLGDEIAALVDQMIEKQVQLSTLSDNVACVYLGKY